jgi:predicted RNA binding protein YcfA (HicA-like mRNA interferase family)
MASPEKTLQKMRNNPHDWRIEDLKAIANRLGISYRQPTGSHVQFHAPNGQRVSVPAARPILPVYVRKFIAMVDSLEK